MSMWKSLGQVWPSDRGGPALDCYYQLARFGDELSEHDEHMLCGVAYSTLADIADSGRGFRLDQTFETVRESDGFVATLLFQPHEELRASGRHVVVTCAGATLTFPIN